MRNLKAKVQDVVTDEILVVREKRWKKLLPESFKNFIKEYNGGILEDTIVIDDKTYVERFLCIVPKISESSNGEYDIDAVATKFDEFMVFDENTRGYDLIPFAQLNHDSLLCLCYEDARPSVVLWKLEGSEKFKPNYKICFPTFDEFLKFNALI